MRKRLLFHRVNLQPGGVAPRHAQLTVAIEAHLANAAPSGADPAAVRAGQAAHSILFLRFHQSAGDRKRIEQVQGCVHTHLAFIYYNQFKYAKIANAMDEKTLNTLEYPKVLERLAAYAAFSASAELARALHPTRDLQEARDRLATTTEARHLLSVNDNISIGGASDVRPLVDLARRGGVLQPSDLLAVKNTLIVARELARIFEKYATQYPRLAQIAAVMPPPGGVIEAITRAISERGEVMDSASPALSALRSEMKVAHERLMSRLERMINDPNNAGALQEPIITQRNGRYVIPLRADFKGRIRSIVHDQSSSGQTVFVEPLVVVELNNRYQEVQLAERDEVRRILADLSWTVGKQHETIDALTLALAQLDLALMCAKYAEDLKATEPVLRDFEPPSANHPGSTVRLFHARHPLLDPATVVPIEVVLEPGTFAVVITGPNTGGKTVTLKTVGLMTLMAQSGLHIPAQSGSEISLFENVFADIGDEQSIEQSLSTFSGHITNIVRVLRRANERCLVLFDELGAGTDPQEGSALARAILSHLVERRITCLVATHYPELKAFAHATPGVVNASMEFNLRTLRPTYHLTIGLPGRSNALAIVTRLGLADEIIQTARAMLDPNDLRAEDLLNEIHHQRDVARKARSDADRLRSQAENLRNELTKRLEKIEDERQALLTQAAAQAENEIATLRSEMDDLRRELARARQPLDALRPLQEKVEELEVSVPRPARRVVVKPSAAPRPLRPGDKVRLRSLKLDGVVTALGESEVEVQIGNLRVRAKLNDIERPQAAGDAPAEAPAAAPASAVSAAPVSRAIFQPSPGMELDIRGERAEDALDALDRYLDSAYSAGLPFVRIIHGKGTGRLRQVIREALRASPHVASFESGQDKEGGDGVTVAKIRSD